MGIKAVWVAPFPSLRFSCRCESYTLEGFEVSEKCPGMSANVRERACGTQSGVPSTAVGPSTLSPTQAQVYRRPHPVIPHVHSQGTRSLGPWGCHSKPSPGSFRDQMLGT